MLIPPSRHNTTTRLVVRPNDLNADRHVNSAVWVGATNGAKRAMCLYDALAALRKRKTVRSLLPLAAFLHPLVCPIMATRRSHSLKQRDRSLFSP
jgi:hypothetical protein